MRRWRTSAADPLGGAPHRKHTRDHRSSRGHTHNQGCRGSWDRNATGSGHAPTMPVDPCAAGCAIRALPPPTGFPKPIGPEPARAARWPVAKGPAALPSRSSPCLCMRRTIVNPGTGCRLVNTNRDCNWASSKGVSHPIGKQASSQCSRFRPSCWFRTAMSPWR